MRINHPVERESVLRGPRPGIAAAGGLVGALVASVEIAVIRGAAAPLHVAPAQLLAAQLGYALVGAASSIVVAAMFPRLRRGRRAAAATAAGMLLLLLVASRPAAVAGVAVLVVAAVAAASAALGNVELADRRARPVAAVLACLILASPYRRPVEPAQPAPPPPASGPDVALVVIDTLRADHLGSYGAPGAASPFLDRLSRGAATFSDASATAPWTRPSVGSLLTGRLPSAQGVEGLWGKLPEGVPTLAEMLAARGFQTGAFSATVQVSPLFGLARGFAHFEAPERFRLQERLAAGRLVARLARLAASGRGAGGAHEAARDPSAGELNARVARWLATLSPVAPALLYVHYIDPHEPYAPPGSTTDRTARARLHRELSMPLPRPPFPVYEKPAAAQDVQAIEALYREEVAYVDLEVGRLVRLLGARRAPRPRYLLVTADHGEEMHEHGQWLHGNSLFEELLRVPLVIAGPGVRPRVAGEPVQLVDVLPTIAELVGGELVAVLDGISLGPALRGEPLPSRTLYGERLDAPVLLSVRQERRKLVRVEAGGETLWMEYDLEADPGEGTRAGSPSPDLVELLEARRRAAATLAREPAAPGLPEDARARLKALGYLD